MLYDTQTLKWLLQWIENPTNSKCATHLERNIPKEKDREMTGKRITNPVKSQLSKINALSTNLKV